MVDQPAPVGTSRQTTLDTPVRPLFHSRAGSDLTGQAGRRADPCKGVATPSQPRTHRPRGTGISESDPRSVSAPGGLTGGAISDDPEV